MKKVLLTIVLLLSAAIGSSVFAQDWKYQENVNDFDRYEWNIKYIIKKGSNVYTTNKEIVRTVEKESPLTFNGIDFPVYKDESLSLKRYKDYLFFDEANIEYYSINDVYVEGSDLLLEEIIYTPGSFGFVPVCYNEVVESENPRKKMEEVIPVYQELYGIKEYGESEFWWQEKRFLNAFEVRFSNVIFSIDYYTGGTDEFLITNIIKKGNRYILQMYPPKAFDNYYELRSGFENFPASENSEIITLILEINPSTLKLYNQDNEFICELMKVSNEWLLDFPNLLENEVHTENLKPVDLSKTIFNITDIESKNKEEKMTDEPKPVEEAVPAVKNASSLPLVIIVASVVIVLLCIVIIIIVRKKRRK